MQMSSISLVRHNLAVIGLVLRSWLVSRWAPNFLSSLVCSFHYCTPFIWHSYSKSHLDFVQGCRSVNSWVLSVVLVRIVLLLVLYMQNTPHPLLWCLVLIWVYVHAYNLFMYTWRWCFLAVHAYEIFLIYVHDVAITLLFFCFCIFLPMQAIYSGSWSYHSLVCILAE